MIDPDLQQLPEREEQELIAKLKQLRRVTPPADFSEKLRLRIQQEEQLQPAQVYTLPSTKPTGSVFPYRRVAFGVAAAAVVTFAVMKIVPDKTTDLVVSASAPTQTSETTTPVQLPPVAEQRMNIAAAPVEKDPTTKSAPALQREVRNAATPSQQEPAAKPSTTTTAHRTLPPELLYPQQSDASPLHGGRLSTAATSTGSPLRAPGLQAGFDSAPAGATPFMMRSAGIPAGTIQQRVYELQRADSIHKQDSLRKLQHQHKQK